MRKSVKAKVVQIHVAEMPELVRLAQERGIKDTEEMAKWIISVSPHWRSQGFKEIINAINQTGSVNNTKK